MTEVYIRKSDVMRLLKKHHRNGGIDVDGDWVEGTYSESLYDDIQALPPVILNQTDRVNKWKQIRRELLERGDEMVSFRQLVERFDAVEEEYPNQSWNLMQIYNNFNILIGKEFKEIKQNRKISDKLNIITFEIDYLQNYIEKLQKELKDGDQNE